MASEASSYASSCLQADEAPKELLELLGILKEQQYQQHHRPKNSQNLFRFCDNPQGNEVHKLHAHNQHLCQQPQTLEQPKKSPMELSQIELIYRAEGNANLVLALPQFKKVLRLPKIQQKCAEQTQQQQQGPEHEQSQLQWQQISVMEQQPQHPQIPFGQKYPGQHKQQCQRQEQQQQHGQLEQEQQVQQSVLNQQEPKNTILNSSGQQRHLPANAVGILTMDHYVAYIGIIRCLLGNDFVFEADIVALPNPNDSQWINEHIKPFRPANRLDKEFGGHYGLLLPDATQLPAEFDILFSNLQPLAIKASQQSERRSEDTASGARDIATVSGTSNDNIFLEDTYAIEIKPKQGWLLPNDVNNLFDINQATPATPPPTSTSMETPTPMPQQQQQKALESATRSSYNSVMSCEGTLKTSTNKEYFRATQTKPSSSMPVTLGVETSTAASTRRRDDKKIHPLHDEVDIRCRYCSMQFLKMKQKKIVQASNYCPMDLFSGVPARMWNALHALFMCPQNNLRIFKNGIVVFDDQLSRLSKIEDLFPSDKVQIIKHLLVTSLLRDFEQDEQNTPATAAANEEDIVYGEVKMSKAARKGVKAKNREEQNVSDADGCCCSVDGTEYGECHVSVSLSKKQKINISLGAATTSLTSSSSPSTTENETEAELVATKVKTTFTNTTTNTTTNLNVFTQTPTTSNTQVRPDAKPSVWISSGSGYCSPTSHPVASDVSVGQMNKPEMLSLPKNCVLQKILYLQLLAKQHLPYMLEHKYQNNKEKSYGILNGLLTKFANAKEKKFEISQLSPEEQYLLAATSMDCSVMIAFRQVPNEENPQHKSFFHNDPHMICINGQYFICKITLLDLDPKPDSHFAKYVKQTKEILLAMPK
ncbi:inositol phosphate kinase 1 [Haematobia irritans]|uniref:inositol phosphate kinase 1 n=1 Tax=Haematobia irritans TaxID=7368 RepID=UPI003F5018B4